jgi:hypothetical protein
MSMGRKTMDAVYRRLRRLRDWFLVWFVAEAAAGTAAAAYVLDGMGRHSLLKYATGGVDAAGTVLAGLVVSLILLLLALALLESLISLHAWARTCMLVIGWVTVVSAALNLLTLPGSTALIEPFVQITGGDWTALVAASAVTKLGDLAFWSWAIYVLQLDPAIRDAFCHPTAHPAGPDPRPHGWS